MQGKRVSESATEQVHLLMPEHINGRNRLFGGRLMEWLDSFASIVARRHCGSEVITACVDSLEFEAPAYVNSTILMKGMVTYTGRTSLEVRVDTYTEALDGKRERINKAYFVFVAIDSSERPIQVPPLALENDAQRKEYEAGALRAARRKENRKKETAGE